MDLRRPLLLSANAKSSAPSKSDEALNPEQSPELSWGDKEQWFVQAKRRGTAVIVSFMFSFGKFPSAELAIERVLQELENNPQFKAEMKGWTFFIIPAHYSVHVV
jgi:hypothetical protein